jgi:ribonuclease HI
MKERQRKRPKMRKGTPNEVLRAEFHTRIFTDESKKEEKVGYTVVTDQQSTRRRIRDHSSISSAEQEATIDAIQKLPTTGVRGVIFTDSLSTASGNNHTKNPKTRKIRQLMDKRQGNVPLCWVPGLAEKTGNKEADEEAKRALDESIPNDEKYPPENLTGWRAAEKQGGKRGECNQRENTAWQIDTKKLKTRDQMALTKLNRNKMEGTPDCPFFSAKLTLEHILWQCKEAEEKRQKSNMTKEVWEEGEEGAKVLVEFVKNIGLYYGL